MTGISTLWDLRSLGAAVERAGEHLRVSPPEGRAIPRDLLARAKADKTSIWHELRREHMTVDPRSDLALDHYLWMRLLNMAYDRDGIDVNGLAGALHGLRCCGAVLVRGDDGYLRLSLGEITAGEYAAFRERYLMPHADTLVALLKALSLEGEM